MTSGRPGTICGICWIAPKAAAKLHVNISVTRIVVNRRSGANKATIDGLRRVAAWLFCCQAGDSGRNGRMTINGRAVGEIGQTAAIAGHFDVEGRLTGEAPDHWIRHDVSMLWTA